MWENGKRESMISLFNFSCFEIDTGNSIYTIFSIIKKKIIQPDKCVIVMIGVLYWKRIH